MLPTSGAASNAIEPAETRSADLQELSTLVEIGQALASLDLEEALPRVLDALARLDGVVRGSLLLRDPDTGKVEFEQAAGVVARRSRARSLSVPIAIGGRAIGAVGVDLRARASHDGAGPVGFLRVVGLMLAQAVRFHRLRARSRGTPAVDGGPTPLVERLEEVERGALEDALRSAHGNRAKAARLLSTTERIFYYRVRKYGIDWKRFKA